MIISLIGQKGGIGKTTIGCCLAVELTVRGFKVAVVDIDDQGTAIEWASTEGDAPNKPMVVRMGDNVRDKLYDFAEGWDVVIIDTPGKAGKRPIWAMAQSDLVLLPCGATGPEIWAMGTSIEQVQEVQARNPDLQAAIVITRKQKGTVLGRQVKDALIESGIPILDTEIHQRITYGEAITAGLGPTTYQGGKSEAAVETRKLVDELLRRYFKVTNVA